MDPRKKRNKRRNSSSVYIKTIVLGDSGVGKTCLINRYVGGFYQDNFTPTLGIDFKVKSIQKESSKQNLQIWDTAGQERFKTITKSYFQGCQGVLLIFSLTDHESFKNIQKWLSQLEQHASSKLVKILVGTKVDCPDERVVEVSQCSEIANKHDLEYFEVSAKTGYNITNVFQALSDRIIEKNQQTNSNYFQERKIHKSIKLISSNFKTYQKCQC